MRIYAIKEWDDIDSDIYQISLDPDNFIGNGNVYYADLSEGIIPCSSDQENYEVWIKYDGRFETPCRYVNGKIEEYKSIDDEEAISGYLAKTYSRGELISTIFHPYFDDKEIIL